MRRWWGEGRSRRVVEALRLLGHCPRGEGPLWPPTHAVGHPSPGAWPALPEGALGPRPSPWGRSSPQVFLKAGPRPPSAAGWSLPHLLPTWGSPTRNGPSVEAQGRGPLPTSSSSRCCSPAPLRAPAGRPCCPPASVPDPIEDRVGQETHSGGAAARLGGRVLGEGEGKGGQVWAPGCLSACRSPVLPQTAGVR